MRVARIPSVRDFPADNLILLLFSSLVETSSWSRTEMSFLPTRDVCLARFRPSRRTRHSSLESRSLLPSTTEFSPRRTARSVIAKTWCVVFCQFERSAAEAEIHPVVLPSSSGLLWFASDQGTSAMRRSQHWNAHRARKDC